jgi:hypothetical protein
VHVGWPLLGAGHSRSQPLQCSTFDCVSTHEPSQFWRSEAQVVTHSESSHTSFGAHGWLQPPQWLTSELVSTQPPAQDAKPSLHAARHSPPTQLTRPFDTGSQETPHFPQFSGSDPRFLQTPPHTSYGAEHDTPQPLLHTAFPCSGVGHAVAQSPQ